MKKITKFFALSFILLLFNVSAAQTARLQAIHNCADAAAATVDVYVNGILLLDDFAFRTATPFINAPAGVPLSIDVAPGNSTSSAQSLYNLTTTLTANETYILVANGIVSASGYSPSQPFELSVFAQGREFASNSGNTDILVNHGSTDAPTVDVVETSVPAGIIVDNISYPSFTADYLQLPTADYTLNVTNATGTSVVASYAAPLNTLGLQGRALTVLASGFLNPAQNSNGPAFGLWVALSSGGNLIPLPVLPLSNKSFYNPDLKIYPNPASTVLNLYIPSNSVEKSAIIVDMSGRVIKFLSSFTNKIDVSDLTNGLYIINLNLDGKAVSEKFMVFR